MKPQQPVLVFTMFVATIGATVAFGNIAQGQVAPVRLAETSSTASTASSTTFFCKVIDGVPYTMARVALPEETVLVSSPQANSSATSPSRRLASSPSPTTRTSTETIEVIQWGRKYYDETKETPLTRCTRVSGIIQTYNRKQILGYITSGEMDGQQVICATSESGGPCSLLLYTLNEEDNPNEVVKILRKVISNPEELTREDSNIAPSWYGEPNSLSNPNGSPSSRGGFSRRGTPSKRIGGGTR